MEAGGKIYRSVILYVAQSVKELSIFEFEEL